MRKWPRQTQSQGINPNASPQITQHATRNTLHNPQSAIRNPQFFPPTCPSPNCIDNGHDMSKQIDHITPELADWISRQKIFFVASVPLAAAGHINCSPKGGDCFKILGPLSVAYQDYTGSGAETVAHLKENGRIVIMFC